MNFDVVVVGAGMAGTIFARETALAGLKTALIDKNTGGQFGHDWWDTIEKSIFDKVDLSHPTPPELLKSPDVYALVSPLETVKTIATFQGSYTVDRKPLAQRLIREAKKAGAEMFEGWKVERPLTEGDRVVGVAAKSPEGEEVEFRATLTMDATGFRGAIRRQLPFETDFEKELDPADTFVTYREIRNKTDKNKRGAIVFFGKSFGVEWINYEQDGLVDLFAGYINRNGHPNPKDTVDNLRESHEAVGDEIKRGGFGAPIPVRRCLDSFVANGFLLAGDAACQCNPLDGSGMASSLWGGWLAAQTAIPAVRSGDVSIPALWPYNAAYKSTKGKEFAFLYGLQKFMVTCKFEDLEMLFTRRVINAEEFWGRGVGETFTFSKRVEVAARLIDRPRFLFGLATAMAAADRLRDLHEKFPKEYDPKAFEKWKESVNRIVKGLSKQ